jgi:hypothetical protein
MAAHDQRLAKKMVSDGKRDFRPRFRLPSLGLPRGKIADAADVVFHFDRINTVPENLYPDVVTINEYVQAPVVLLPGAGCRDMGDSAANDPAAKRCCDGF